VVEIKRGQYVFQEGELGTEMFIIQNGRVEIRQELSGSSIQVAVLEKGDFFGEMSVLEDLPRNATARALTDAKLIPIDGATFDAMLRSDPEIGVRIMRKLSRRVRETDELFRRAVKEGEIQIKVEQVSPLPSASEDSPARLTHAESGVEYRLPGTGTLTIGRRDPVTQIQPDVDLSSIDPERSSSRRHAKIFRDGEEYFLVEDIGATNGTFLNGARIRTGVPVTVRSGDVVRLGLVELNFLTD
jgi:CRP-like cAMP-binding protein